MLFIILRLFGFKELLPNVLVRQEFAKNIYMNDTLPRHSDTGILPVEENRDEVVPTCDYCSLQTCQYVDNDHILSFLQSTNDAM